MDLGSVRAAHPPSHTSEHPEPCLPAQLLGRFFDSPRQPPIPERSALVAARLRTLGEDNIPPPATPLLPHTQHTRHKPLPSFRELHKRAEDDGIDSLDEGEQVREPPPPPLPETLTIYHYPNPYPPPPPNNPTPLPTKLTPSPNPPNPPPNPLAADDTRMEPRAHQSAQHGAQEVVREGFGVCMRVELSPEP